MAKVLENRALAKDFFLMRVAHKNSAEMGQFYMLRAWGRFPLLSRPISVFDADGETVSFLYKVIGEGTQMFAALKAGDEISLLGPNGTPFPQVTGKIALAGAGVGAAPLYYAAKRLKEIAPDNHVDMYLARSVAPFLKDLYEQVADRVIVNPNGFVTEAIEPTAYDYIFACGPDVMMMGLRDKCRAAGVPERIYLSLEERMGCGFGICVGCVARIQDEKNGLAHKKVCVDGPVFRGEEVLFHA